jgi:hypothetical protein
VNQSQKWFIKDHRQLGTERSERNIKRKAKIVSNRVNNSSNKTAKAKTQPPPEETNQRLEDT